MKSLIDMHVHSFYSDGEYTPNELVAKAKSLNVLTMAITDHDTIDGIKVLNRDNCNGVTVYNGIELSAKVDKGKMHILGYDFNISDDALNKKMTDLKNNRINSLLATYVQLMQDTGISFSYEELKNIVNAKHNIGKPDLALLLKRYVNILREYILMNV